MSLIRFLPEGKTLTIEEPVTVSEAAATAGILIEHPCGGKGECAKCRVRFHEGAPPPSEADRRQLDATLLDQGWRLACQTVLDGPATLEIPPSGRSVGAKSFGPDNLFDTETWLPSVRVTPFNLPPPTLGCQASELDALEEALLGGHAPAGCGDSPVEIVMGGDGDAGGTKAATENVTGGGGDAGAASFRPAAAPPPRLEASIPMIRGLATTLAALDRTGEATLCGRRLIALESEGLRHGVAVDVGSTTVAVGLIDLTTGAVVASASELNPQTRYGGDVVARIHFASQRPDGNLRLHEAVVGVVADLIRRVCETAGLDPRDVVAAAFCGNPVMTHTLVGADIRPMGQSPYLGEFTHDLRPTAADLALPIHPEAGVWVFPQVRSNVGGDAVAAALAMGLDRAERPTLLIDLGTNSEIVLGCRDWMLATSTAAGPAFEGHNISHGMRAAPGAVDRVTLTASGHLRARVLGGRVPARGVCGSGLVDAVAVLLDAGVVDPSGRMRRAEEYEATVGANGGARGSGRDAQAENGGAPHPDSIAARLTAARGDRPAVALTRAEDSQDGRPVTLNDLDVRALQLVKGSTRAGAEILMAEAGVAPEDLEAVYLAGAFGNYLRKMSILRIGLIPEVPASRASFAGNAAGVGARMALADLRARDRARAIARRCRYIELSTHPEYTEAFALGMGFPEQ